MRMFPQRQPPHSVCRQPDRDGGAWRLIGIDTALSGSSDSEEEAQQEFLERALRERSGGPVMLQASVPFENGADDIGFTAAAVPRAPRMRLLETYLRHGVAVIACGRCSIVAFRLL